MLIVTRKVGGDQLLDLKADSIEFRPVQGDVAMVDLFLKVEHSGTGNPQGSGTFTSIHTFKAGDLHRVEEETDPPTKWKWGVYSS